MTLAEILKSQGLNDEQVASVTKAMKENSIFTASEENLDVRYGKLKTDHDALVSKDGESQKLIVELQKASKGQEEIQSKIAEYEEIIGVQAEELERSKIELSLRTKLIEKGAKADDIDYLLFKAENKNELKFDDNGEIKGIDDLVTGLMTSCPNQFTGSQEKKFDEKKLDRTDNETKLTKREFDKMGYNSRAKLRAENPELYNELSK